MPVKILDKLTVIECATFVTGPYATALLADLGARVIKIESPPAGDPYRYFAPDTVYSFNRDPRFKQRQSRRENYQALEEALAPTFKMRTRKEWLNRLETNDVPVAPLYNIAEALADAQVEHLQLIDEVEHPVAGKMRFVGAPISFDHQARHPSLAAPLLGEHSAALVRELGRNDETIRRLQENGTLRVREL